MCKRIDEMITIMELKLTKYKNYKMIIYPDSTKMFNSMLKYEIRNIYINFKNLPRLKNITIKNEG
jgi:hypothetical protein